MKLFLPISKFLTGGYLLLCCISGSAGAEGIPENTYQEQIQVHVGRSTYNAGEIVWYKAYGSSNLKQEKEFLSKVLYVELINDQKMSVSSQAIQVEEGKAASYLILPDTLSTGIYFLKAYTNWMKNFGEEYFSSTSLFIFNQYDDEKNEKISEIRVPFEPEVYLQRGKLIADVPAIVAVLIPGYNDTVNGHIVNPMNNHDSLSQVLHAGNGTIVYQFTPQRDGIYYFNLTDPAHGSVSIPLPQVEWRNFAIHLSENEYRKPEVETYGPYDPKTSYSLVLKQGDKPVFSTELADKPGISSTGLNLPDGSQGSFQLLLLDADERILAEHDFNYSGYPGDTLISNTVATRSQAKIKLDLGKHDFQPGSTVSVSVSKLTGLHPQIPGLVSHTGRYFPYRLDEEGPIEILLPRLNQPATAYPSIDAMPYLTEDMGILLTGTVRNPVTKKGLENVEVLLALEDSIGVLTASKTNENGEFSLLVNELRTKPGYFFTFKNSEPFQEDYIISLDSKFFYSPAFPKETSLISRKLESSELNEIEAEAQRILIQRAFNKYKNQKYTHIVSKDTALESFYGEPVLVVYPDEFFFLPNFEEISREILPRVRYRKNKNTCELSVIHVENNLISNSPLALIDGVPIKDYCYLQSLSSDDINRIEVQSGMRVSGNLYYTGSLAIYTTDEYKSKNKGYIGENAFSIIGYENIVDNYVHEIKKNLLNNPRRPEFLNQLYWNPDLTVDRSAVADFSFYTSDEEGIYKIEVRGQDADGNPVRFDSHINIKAD